MKTITKKSFVAGIIIILLILLGTSMFFKSNKDGNPILPAINSPIGINTKTAGIANNLQPENFIPDSADGCPKGEAMNEEKGECEPEDKISDEVVPVGEIGYENVEGYREYIENLHLYSEKSVHHSLNFDNVDGYPLYMRLVSLIKDSKLVFLVGYLDDNNKWHEIKKYDSETTSTQFLESSHPELKKLNGGCFTKHDDPSYKACCGGGYVVVEKPFGIKEKESHYIHCIIEENNCIKNGYGCRGFRTNIKSDSSSLISEIVN